MVEIVKGDVKQNRRKVFDSFCFHLHCCFVAILNTKWRFSLSIVSLRAVHRF